MFGVRPHVPKLCLHKGSGQAFVRVHGKSTASPSISASTARPKLSGPMLPASSSSATRPSKGSRRSLKRFIPGPAPIWRSWSH